MTKQKIVYGIDELIPYINWAYFYFAWQLRDDAGERERMRREAEEILKVFSGRYRAYALVMIAEAGSDGDDIVFNGVHIPMLRQQTCENEEAPSLCLSDFVRPLTDKGAADTAGLFATTVDIGLETDFGNDDYMKMMAQLLADRLAEAAAERLHEHVRKHLWGYAPDEDLTMAELHAGHYRGIRPAVGYPSLPDTSINFIISDILGMGDIGIRLTENGAMKPHASVSGLMLAHPASRYFAIGKIGEDQLQDYARRRGLPVNVLRRFISQI